MTGVKGWIGVDLDGTLAEYDRWRGAEHVGKPVRAMVERVKRWLAEGRYDVKIFTARVSHDGTPGRVEEAKAARTAILAWCAKHVGQVLEITNVKDYAMVELYDDRAVQVVPNTGELATDSVSAEWALQVANRDNFLLANGLWEQFTRAIGKDGRVPEAA